MVYSAAIKNIIRIIIIALAFSFGSKASAQLIIDNTMTPEQLVQNILIGSGVTVSNITFTGNEGNAICAFTNGNTTILGLDEGVILSSGGAGDAANPASVNADTDNGVPGDPDLDVLPGVLGTNDAAILEFDFIPQSDTLTFRYVFGSEEYPEFVNQFNDVFAFFITGPNPSGGNYANENIALIPGTNLPVTINNVNNGTANTGPCINCEYYVNNTGGLYIVYDGFTTVLDAIVIVAPCSTYHMKLTIADDLDFAYDSGVFLEANSFSSTGLIISSNFSSSSPGYGALIEGCNDATIYFELVDTLPDPYVVHFDYMGTAVNGIDYNLLPDSIVIPPGSMIDSLNIIPVQNYAIDPTRTVIIAFDYESACNNEQDTLELLLLDNTIEMSGLDTMYCNSDPPVALTVYPPSGILTGPGTSGTTFDPALASFGMNVIQFTNYFIDFTLVPPDTVCISQVIDTTFVQPQAICGAGTDESICQGSPFDFMTSTIIPWAA
ncbi:MAG: choice-of-anchor L domain-containing protein, partial [Bacteroidales bacterium]|nr:choice-of-anchor L domain-containing protein [Bacteroidales bacterium]